jgi:hypothetical protein
MVDENRLWQRDADTASQAKGPNQRHTLSAAGTTLRLPKAAHDKYLTHRYCQCHERFRSYLIQSDEPLSQ